MTYPDYPPRRGRSGAELAEARRLAVEPVVRFFNAHWHRSAMEVVARAMHEKQPFGLPVEYAPSENPRRYCTQQATEGFEEAMRRIEARQFDEAEDLLHRAFTYAGWGRDLLGMATSLMTLGRLNESGFQAKGEAGAYYEMALAICREIRSESPTAEQLFTVLTQELARLQKGLL